MALMAFLALHRPTPWPSLLTVGLLAFPLWGCSEESVSPKLEPPTTVPMPPILDTSRVSCRSAPSGDAGLEATVVVGEAGAVDPAVGIVRAYNLDDTSPPVEAPIADDGGFEVPLDVSPGSSVRLELIAPYAGSGPSDFVVEELDAPLAPLVEPLGDCLSFDSGYLLWVEPGTVGELVVEGFCDGVELVAPRPRSDRDRIRVGANLDWPLTLENGVPLSVDVEVLEGEPGDEYLFFLEAIAPEPDRRAVSVRVCD